MNINYSHTCEARGGAFVAEPLPSCTADPDLHGWRKVSVLLPECRCGSRRNLCYGIYDTHEQAEDAAHTLAARGIATRITTQPLDNARWAYPSPAFPV